jgi:hypothetical protein
MKTEIEFTQDQVSAIVRQELQCAYHSMRDPLRVPWYEDDTELLNGMQRVIEYYSTPEQYETWQQSLTS